MTPSEQLKALIDEMKNAYDCFPTIPPKEGEISKAAVSFSFPRLRSLVEKVLEENKGLREEYEAYKVGAHKISYDWRMEFNRLESELAAMKKALAQLLDQVERGNLTDDMGHKFLLNESVRYAREALSQGKEGGDEPSDHEKYGVSKFDKMD